jgi:hypothetical protein
MQDNTEEGSSICIWPSYGMKLGFLNLFMINLTFETASCRSSPPASLAILWQAPFDAEPVRHGARAAVGCAPAVSRRS